jgi:hypothetical protein
VAGDGERGSGPGATAASSCGESILGRKLEEAHRAWLHVAGENSQWPAEGAMEEGA